MPRLDRQMRELLDNSGLPWNIENGGKHWKVIIGGRLAGIWPKGQGMWEGRCALNIRAQVRRKIKELQA